MTKSKNLNIVISNRSGVCRIKMAREADIDSINALKKTVRDLEARPFCTLLVVDMEDITFIDSVSLSAFIRLIHLYRRRKNSVCVLKPRKAITGLFDYTGLSKLLVVCHTEKELEPYIHAVKRKRKAPKKAPAKKPKARKK